ncbi:MAG TPA: hypothetical protein VE093_22760 [Polyangiaceae bacterium]|nr:hypothetical protein [Polyangiaceae bacterium]
MTIRWSAAVATALITGLLGVGTAGCGDDETSSGPTASTGTGGRGGEGQGGAGGEGGAGGDHGGQGGAGGGQGGAGGGQGGAGGGAAVCGNGMLEGGVEDCDDSNTNANDGCSPTCSLEAGYQCSGSPSVCGPFCGDSMVVGAEPCDGPELGGKTCMSEGFTGGSLGCQANCVLDTSGCAQGEVCNTGVDEDLDGLVDCADSDCAAHPTCSSADEVLCGNLKDDDLDGLTDCEDSTSCKALAVCQPGVGATGSPCLAPSDCAANNMEPACITEQDYGFPGGYCSEFCDPATNDCAMGAFCLPVNLPSGAGLCVDNCVTDADCRIGYTCQNFGFGSPFCWRGQEDCANGADDDGDFDVDCMDQDCANAPPCLPPEVCNNGFDDNGDGYIDCEDTSCGLEPTCPFSMICAGAIPLTDGVPYSDDTTTGTSTFASYCTGSNGSLEKVFSFTPGMAGQTGVLTVVLSSATDQGIYVRTACEDAFTDLGCVDSTFGGTDEVLNVSVNGGEPVWIFIDGYLDPAAAGPFTVTATFSIPVCGNGVVEVGEECDPPDGVTCDANCQAVLGPETVCSGLFDDDDDGLTDCEDPTDCKALPDCVPGNTPVGNPCLAPSDCRANNTDPVCIDEAQFGWSQGYCAEFCDLSTNDCPAGAVCAPVINVPSGAGLCMDSCVNNADCRPGYTCVDNGADDFCFF